MATSQDLLVNGAEAAATFNDINDDVNETAEKSPYECILIADNQLKYINTNYDKVSEDIQNSKSDVKLKVGEKTFTGHKKVLSDASDYFKAMFTHDMKEKDETEIELHQISAAGFGVVLDYFYNGHVTLEADVIPDVLEAGRFFHIEWILDVCCNYMIQHLSILNYPLTMELADKYSLGDLRWDIFKFFGHNLPSLTEKETFFADMSVELLMQFLMEYMYVEVSEWFLLQVGVIFKQVGLCLPALEVFSLSVFQRL